MGEPMYQVYCMEGTPPLTWEEQEKCLHSKTRCWRLAANQRDASTPVCEDVDAGCTETPQPVSPVSPVETRSEQVSFS